MSIYLFAHNQSNNDKKYSQLGNKKYASLEPFSSMIDQFPYDIPVVQLNRHLMPIIKEANIDYTRNNFNIELTSNEIEKLYHISYEYTKSKCESLYQKRQYDLLFNFLTICLQKNLKIKTY